MNSKSHAPENGLSQLERSVRPRRFDRLSETLGIDLWVQEEYCLPFPFAGNKWIKLVGHYGEGVEGGAYVSNGGINSNHCRSLALWSAFHGHRCHLVLHNDGGNRDSVALDLFRRLGASYSVVDSTEIADSISASVTALEGEGFDALVVPGGGHSSGSTRAYADYAKSVLNGTDFDMIFHASGTGGTQAGLCIACHEANVDTKVVGISVARASKRGMPVVQHSIRETIGLDLNVDFRDGYVDGGYGPGGAATREAVDTAMGAGLLLDTTYTGKAFAGLLDSLRAGEIEQNAKVLFWHTGGLYLVANSGAENG